MEPVDHDAADRDIHDRNGRVAADRDDRGQGNINTLANLMSQQVNAQKETNETQKETNEIFRDQMRVHNEKLISLGEGQLAQQRQINDVCNRINVVESGQVEDREQIAALHKDVLSLRGEFDDMVEKLKRADVAKD